MSDFKCPLCGNSSYSVVHDWFCHCKNCTLVFTDPKKISNVDISRFIRQVNEEREKAFNRNRKDFYRR